MAAPSPCGQYPIVLWREGNIDALQKEVEIYREHVRTCDGKSKNRKAEKLKKYLAEVEKQLSKSQQNSSSGDA